MPDRAPFDEGTSEPAFLPYGKQEIGDADVKAVVEALCSGWLTTGPRVSEFEQAFADHCGAVQGVAVNSGTAALHSAMRAIGVGAGDEVIVPALTFAASANAALYEGATPVFADVEADTLLVDPASVAAKITSATKAIVAVDYAGQPADPHRRRLPCARCNLQGRQGWHPGGYLLFLLSSCQAHDHLRRRHVHHGQRRGGCQNAPLPQPRHRQRPSQP
jgi:hypothetical protein